MLIYFLTKIVSQTSDGLCWWQIEIRTMEQLVCFGIVRVVIFHHNHSLKIGPSSVRHLSLKTMYDSPQYWNELCNARYAEFQMY